MATGPWSVKGIDPRAREAAKAAAQREGLTLGEWMNQRLLNGSASNGDDSHPQTLSYESPRFGAPGTVSSFNGMGRPYAAGSIIEELTARLEAAERRSTLAISGIDQSVLGMVTRLERVERVNDEISSTLENRLDELKDMGTRSRDELDRMMDKVDRSTEDTTRRLETMTEHTEVQLGSVRHELSKELELVNSRSDELSQRLGTAERMTDNAVRTLESSFTAVNERLQRTEKKLGEHNSENLADVFNRRFKVLSEELVHVVAQTRGQLASQIEAQAASPRLDQFEASLRDVRGQFTSSERRHADTLERIASEVGKLGGAIEHRFSEAERNTAIGLDKMLDARFTEFQNDHANAIDKIGDGLTGAITRLEEKLNIVEAQRGSDETLEARIIASEERTASMVEEALARIQDRLDKNAAIENDDNSPVQKAMMALAERLEALEESTKAPPPFDPTTETDPEEAYADTSSSESELNPALEEVLRPPQHFDDDILPALPPLSPDMGEARSAVEHSPVDPYQDHYAPLGDEGVDAFIAPAYDLPEADPYAPAGATADANFVAAARRSMRATNSERTNSDKPARQHGGARKLYMAASVIAILAISAAGAITFIDFSADNGEARGGASQADNQNWDDLIDGQNPSAQPQEMAKAQTQDPAQHAPVLDGAEDTKSAQILDGVTPQPAKPKPAPVRRPVRTAQQKTPARQQNATNTAPITAPKAKPTTPVIVASLPDNIAATAPTPALSRAVPQRPPAGTRLNIQQAAQNGDPVAQFQLASAKLDAGNAREGAAMMLQAANRGLPVAQYRMGKLYEDGLGVSKDEKEGRRWTERAANGGNQRAMHNLAMMFAEGNSVPQNYETAAKWFQEAARMGLTNSQYNLAFLYEQGLGVPESLAQAFAWYSIAAKAGDKGAGERAKEIDATLPTAAKTEAKTIIANFRSRPLDLAANGIFNNVSWARPQLNTAPNIARAQILLARLGYKPGPADGNPGSTTRTAVIAYERDQGLAQTGRIDAALLAKLESSTVN
ncbi:MAG: hypothetical protein COA84_04620 [Robiginitomaculum sp.]|nr:MAG: hypothetical protein COA84_04620 [Robiginitomaculum sp.]